ncbi:hypothetical protein [Paraburkholderia phenazinium]|uniref:Uncharacterized protein n=1 Tax=Paraburkholderia phenazinium TaxID=60549 RepID=A0A1N6FV64_9BURK|nr:hypothetical protein [Paraburkholderia phenazinium]SIN99174.1 hypothetical protein SAMN05444165_0413 [Paraburkholderia phenazinium]
MNINFHYCAVYAKEHLGGLLPPDALKLRHFKVRAEHKALNRKHRH